MNIAAWLQRSALARPAAPALFSGRELAADYGGFAASAAGIADLLARQYGVRPGDRVAIFMPNRFEYLQALFGILWLGAVVVPVNAKLHPAEVDVIVRDSAPRVTVVRSASAARDLTLEPSAVLAVDSGAFAAAAATPRDPVTGPLPRDDSDLAWLFYTSGTTGAPKGVMLEHRHLIAMSLSYLADVDEVHATDAAVYAAPLSHGAGLYAFVHVLRGARHVLPASGGFDAREVLDLARDLGNVSMFAAPTMVRRLTAAARSDTMPGDGIRTIVYGGGPMYRADIDAAIDLFGYRLAQIYGQGESPMTITALTKQQHETPGLRGTVGTPHSVVDVRVVRDDGTPSDVGDIGEIEVRGATVMAGYWRNEEATAAALHDGWLRTGDRGRLGETGYLTLAGRSKELIISGGANIYPREVEDVLVSHPAVAEAAVVGVPDEEWGEIVVAVVVADSAGVSPAELDSHCLASLARFKRPRHYLYASDLPKNNYGKVRKTELTWWVASAIHSASAAQAERTLK